MKIRNIFHILHRTLGLVSGLVVFIVAITGATQAFEEELRAVLQREYLQVPRSLADTVFTKPSAIMQTMHKQFPHERVEQIRFRYAAYPVQPKPTSLEAPTFLVLTESDHTYSVHPYTGQVLGVRDMKRDVLTVALELHTDLLLGRFGERLGVNWHEVGEEIIKWNVAVFTVLLLIGKLVGKHAEPCAEKAMEILTPFCDKLKSITADNGKEFAAFERIAECLELGIVEQLRLFYVFNVSESNYSDLNAYNMFNRANAWFALTWTSLAAVFVVVGLAAWQRGVMVAFRKRLPAILRGITPICGAVMACCGLAFVGGEYTLYQTINLENGFKTSTEERTEAAAYERTYKHIKSAPQPKIINLTATVELYPQDRRAGVLAAFTLKNTTKSPIDTLHLEYEDFCRMLDIRVEGSPALVLKHDDEFRHITVKLPRTLLPNDTMSLKTSSTLAYTGFTQGEQQGNLTFNGTYLRWDECFPTFGYNSARELLANRHRCEQGLELIASRLPLIGNSAQHRNTAWSNDADRLHYRITLGTAADQTPLTAGKQTKSEQRNGRNYATFEGFGVWNGTIISAQFTRTLRPCSLASGNVVNIELYRHAEHPYNADLMLRSAEEAVKFYAARFGLQPPTTLRIVEIPQYTEESFAFANTIAIPEKHGWTADARKPEDANYARYLVARQIAASLLADCITPANVQGAPILTHTLPQYAALRFLAAYRHDSFIREHLNRRTTRYFKGSGKEPNAEPSLLLADDDNVPDGEGDLNGYVSVNKGGAVLFGLAEQCGAMKFDSLLKAWFSTASGGISSGKSFTTAAELYGFLRTAFSRENPALLAMLNESFEERVQYSLRLESASLQGLATQETELTLNIRFSKRAHRGDGTSTALPVNDRITCAVQDVEGNTLWRGMIPLTTNEATVRLRIPQFAKKPTKIVLDPHNTLLEGSRTDNKKTL